MDSPDFKLVLQRPIRYVTSHSIIGRATSTTLAYGLRPREAGRLPRGWLVD